MISNRVYWQKKVNKLCFFVKKQRLSTWGDYIFENE